MFLGVQLCWLPASGSSVLLSINQTLSTQAVLGPVVGLVGNTTHSSIHGQVSLNIDTCCGIPTDAPLARLHSQAGTTMAESQDEARQRSASGHAIHWNAGRPRTRCREVNIPLLVDVANVALTWCQKLKAFQLGSRSEPRRFICYIKMKLKQLEPSALVVSIKVFPQSKSGTSNILTKYNCRSFIEWCEAHELCFSSSLVQ